MYYANINQKEVGVILFLSYKLNFKVKIMAGGLKGSFHKKKVSNSSITTLNVYTPKYDMKYVKQIEKNNIIMRRN
jgi:hypothetical protein